MAQPIRIGIVGCGRVLRDYMAVIDRLAERGLAVAVAACDVREAQRAVVKEQYGLGQFTTDYRDIVQAAEVDLVLVLASMQQHGPIALAALAAGKHVLIEKPMAVSLEEAAQVVELARQSAGLAVCAPFVVLSATHQAIRRRLLNGDIGAVLSARARYGTGGPLWDRRFFQAGGGALFDLGVYNLTSLTGWLGPVKQVMALSGIAIPERTIAGETVRVEAEDNAQVLLDFGGSVFAALTTGYTMRKYRSPAIELFGSDGSLQLLGDDWAPQGYELWQAGQGDWQTVTGLDEMWSWTDGLGHLVECINTGARPLTTLEHAFHVHEVMVKAKQSAAEGRAKPIESTFSLPEPGREAD